MSFMIFQYWSWFFHVKQAIMQLLLANVFQWYFASMVALIKPYNIANFLYVNYWLWCFQIK
jgi:hypothetical protein